ncbi:hypothetical protein Vadar_008879 [Vaccinium darrowii]|uniref:Uncharacterized protein n=1 Tax=Vaccinium darrowii TaxID=229202 RepID=A0ACB7Z324_9ERIC|nr:hypothetical protein Vadar_008879 [Vaccinium darrowii]
MGWWHNVRRKRGWLSFSARLSFHKSGGDKGRSGCGADTNDLLQLRDEVKMCSYKDVHVMWNILNGMDANIPAPKPTRTTTTKRRSFWSWRVLFWSNNH